jgi:hypothetical protein
VHDVVLTVDPVVVEEEPTQVMSPREEKYDICFCCFEKYMNCVFPEKGETSCWIVFSAFEKVGI